MNAPTKDPDMAYWNNLPKIGWHIPDHLRIVGGKVKSPEHGTIDRSASDRKTYLNRLAKKKAVRPKPLVELEKPVYVVKEGELPTKNAEGSTQRCTVFVEFPDGRQEVFPSTQRAAWAIGVTASSLRVQTGEGRPSNGCAVKIVRPNGSFTQSFKSNTKPKKAHNAKKVILYHKFEEIRCDSMVEAAKRLGVTDGSVRKAFMRGTKIRGWSIREA